jgi:hypothetical protein
MPGEERSAADIRGAGPTLVLTSSSNASRLNIPKLR